jgi:tRNA(Ile2)-agmatinylcytidine synthase
MDKKFTTTFNNYDYLNSHVCIAPNSPCPILFGIRGERPEILKKAMRMVRSEPIDRWLIFLTNQGTDDHMMKTKISSIKPYTSVVVNGRVVSLPRTIPGGHVIFRISDRTGEIDAAAYEPSKQFRNVVRELIPGDRLTAYGGVRAHPRALNVEKLNVLRLAEKIEKAGNPKCSACKKSMKSRGSKMGFRCVRCRRKLPFSAADFRHVPRKICTDWYEPPPSARRHIYKPLKRVRVTNVVGR